MPGHRTRPPHLPPTPPLPPRRNTQGTSRFKQLEGPSLKWNCIRPPPLVPTRWIRRLPVQPFRSTNRVFLLRLTHPHPRNVLVFSAGCSGRRRTPLLNLWLNLPLLQTILHIHHKIVNLSGEGSSSQRTMRQPPPTYPAVRW